MSDNRQENTDPEFETPRSEDYSQESQDILSSLRSASNEGEKEPQQEPEQDEMRVRWLVAMSPQTHPRVLAALAREAAAALLQRIAENPRTPPEVLAELAEHHEAEVRVAVAENRNTSQETAWRLVRDENLDVRYILAESYHLPKEMLELLADDDNPYVAVRARKTLNRLYSADIVEGTFNRPDEKVSNQQ